MQLISKPYQLFAVDDCLNNNLKRNYIVEIDKIRWSPYTKSLKHCIKIYTMRIPVTRFIFYVNTEFNCSDIVFSPPLSGNTHSFQTT